MTGRNLDEKSATNRDAADHATHSVAKDRSEDSSTSGHRPKEHARLEAHLLESEERYRCLVEASPSAIMAVRDGLFVYVNPAGAHLLGRSDPAELIGLPAIDVVAPESREHVIERIRRLQEGKDNPQTEIQLVRSDGAIIVAESRSIAINLRDGLAAMIIAQDITERKRVEELLRHSENRYHTLVEHAPDAIFLVDATTGQFLDCNRQALELFGYSREEMLSFTPVDFSPPLAPDGRPVPEVLQERLASLIAGKQIVFEWVHLHTDGHEIPCEIRAVLLPSSGRRMLRASMIDITERKQARETLKGRLQFQELVSRISTRFIGLSGIEFEQAIHDALAEIGRYFNSDTVRLYRLSPQGDVLKIRNTWRDEHLAPPKEMAAIHKMKYPNLAAGYAKGEATVFGRFDDSPRWPEMRKILKFFGTKAGVGVPLEVDDSGVDVFAMDKVLSDHVWPKGIVEQSKAVGQVILSAMRRREAEVELQNSYDEIKELKDRLEMENIYLRDEVKIESRHGEIVGDSPAIRKVLALAEQVAHTDSTVLILGETGTGKELLARAIHDLSNRQKRTMVKVNCAALPSTLIEGELFGREKGAYTGALTEQKGRFEIADGSTIFLDEIGELSGELQVKLLRVLQDGQFERLGSSETIKVDVRVIAATNRDLAKAVAEGVFREDLFYRLNVFPVTVPPLRDRPADIPALVWTFIKEFSQRMGKRIESVPNKAMEALRSYPWPGNVRELRNVVEHSMILSRGTSLNIQVPRTTMTGANILRDKNLEEVEKDHITEVLKATGWRIRGTQGAAEILGLKPTTLEARMKKLGIRRR